MTHTYTNVRCRTYTYYATLEALDALGNKNTHTEQVDPGRRMDFPAANQAPIADFTASCLNLHCVFDGSASRDPDGTIASYMWDFGNGNTGSGVTSQQTYAAAGSYPVRLTVADNLGAAGSRSQMISVVAAGFNLTATTRLTRGLQKVVLQWTGASSSEIDVYRNGAYVGSTANDGVHTDDIDLRGSATYTHRVCEKGTTVCSNTATVVFQ